MVSNPQRVQNPQKRLKTPQKLQKNVKTTAPE